MDALDYMSVLAEYVQRFEDRPPSILDDRSALQLMEKALKRGTPIGGDDLAPPYDPFARRRQSAA
jgi:hypothetical protein